MVTGQKLVLLKLIEKNEARRATREDASGWGVLRHCHHEIEEKREKLSKESPVEDLGDAGLLDELPILEVPLSKAPPDKLRILFETLRLSVRYNKLTNKALAEVVLELAGLEDLKGLFTNALRAPNGIRTRVSTLKG